ncbi:putative General secretion pathway protein I, GspI [Bradyrhizobium sp. ORS 278]|uniref:prepilin-type N-terminal cleavage/methylation domain-containing protein n=1 Tax=Bradyrhizobium sp. (strain ORS 278) TaxID=114615 RepID=UPI00015081DC|nr:prepilin-type N-terminal cleavage/methylation domain-containing protein [Bradyrhizobium sp. ORS 278]CAL79979.1 putative General secretion pathway protein I, GspI [Bradyrhizobium sp. ORS 278]
MADRSGHRLREAGFTLIEVLVALAVVSVSIVAIGAVVARNVTSVRKLEQHVTLVSDARLALATLLSDRSRLQPGSADQRSGSGSVALQISPLGGDWSEPAGQQGWIPEMVTLRVRTASGAIANMQTVRLVQGPRR